LLVAVKDRAAVRRASPDAAQLAGILADASAQGCYLFSLDPTAPSAIAHARFFNPTGAGLRLSPIIHFILDGLASHYDCGGV
jgi:predicted PhzF superfamily epimerase YddE/YHI9